MRKVIALIVLGVLCVALLSSPAQALDYDSRNPGPAERVSHAVSGDDSGWADEKASARPNGLTIWSLIGSLTPYNNSTLFIIDLIFVPTTDVGGDDIGNNEADNTGTTLEDRGSSSR